jgi:hypothetical protein
MMNASDPNLDLDFGGPARYRIVIQGSLEEFWSERLAGLAIRVIDRGDRMPHTALEGPIRDQAELNGVIETLYGLHLPIVKVEQITDESPTANDTGSEPGEAESER